MTILEAADDRQPVRERRQRLEDAAERGAAAVAGRRPLVHDRAVREVDERQARHRPGGGGRQQRRAGIIASSSGSATVAPMPRRNVRRSRCFFEMNMAGDLAHSAPAGIARRRHRAARSSSRTSCVVMNSSSTGLPSLVARMPLTIACTTCSGSVTRSP